MPLVVFDGLSIQHSGLCSSIIDHEKDELQMALFGEGGYSTKEACNSLFASVHASSSVSQVKA